MNPRTALEQGAAILGEFLYQLGFEFEIVGEGLGSGGNYAEGEFRKGDLKLELHFRKSLGLVRYHYKDSSVSHEYYMDALGVSREAMYPGFSSDPIDGFRHLKHDLEKFSSDFTTGFHEVLKRASTNENNKIQEERKFLSAGYEGDGRKRQEGRCLFKEKKYSRCIQVFSDVHYPELLTSSEKKMIEIAKKKV